MSLTTEKPLSARDRRRAHADATADWRQRTKGRPESRVVDRVVLEAVTVVLADRSIVPAALAAEVGKAMADAALLGLERLGYDDAPSRRALAVRLAEHSWGHRASSVRPALRDVEMTGAVRRVRSRNGGVTS